MSIKTTWTKLRGLYDMPYCKDYNVVGRETVTRTIKARLPMSTCAAREGGYLEAYQDYYNESAWARYNPYSYRYLKSEYVDNRPTYDVEVTYDLLEVELTPRGRAKAQQRYEMHKRNMERYAKLLEG